MYRSGNGFRKYATCADRFKVNKHLVKEIFVDETLIQIDGQDYWLWIAYDEPNINSCLMMMHLSKERTSFICYRIFKQLRTRYGSRNPIYTDGAHWYKMMLVNGFD